MENEIEKLREDNHVLQVNVNKHEKLVYGSVGAVAPKGTLMKAIPSRVSNTSVPPTPTRSRTPISTPHGTPLGSERNTPSKRHANYSGKHPRAPSPVVSGHSGIITGGIAGGMSGIISSGSGGMSSLGGVSDAARLYLERDKENASILVAKSFTNGMKAIEKQKKKRVQPKKPSMRGTFGTGERFK